MKNRIGKKDKPNSRRIQNGLFCAASIGIAMISGCGDKKHNDDNKNFNGGGGGQSLQTVTADFSGAVGVLVIDSSQSGSLRLNGFANESMSLADSGSNDTSLVKVDNQGDIKSALSTAESDSENGGCCQQPLPRIKTIAVSPNKEIYLHFERPFVYKAPDSPEGWSKANDPVNGYQCQIFKVKGGDLDDLRVNPPDPSAGNLECLDSEHFVDSWQAQRNSVFQFDKDSNVYYPGSLPNGGGKMVVYKRTADGTTSEVINSNICVQDFLVAKSGGVFYTGTSKCDGSGGGSGGFFRYVSPSSSVIEIARDWWNFVFEPISTSSADKAVFFGPDPRSSTTASWNSACLFAFDPAGGSSASDRINNVITCGADIWSWIQMTRTEDVAAYGSGYQNGNSSPSNAWITEFKSRCESSGKVFAGGGSQISAIKQTSDGAT
ncbi:MAG: hypothetical protein NTX25_05025, partial [Proteobacteria bacterium]|nr:hypothetical protein [Pseudomonadota bacterium]